MRHVFYHDNISFKMQFSKWRNPPPSLSLSALSLRIKSNQMHFDHAAPSVADWLNQSLLLLVPNGAIRQTGSGDDFEWEINRHQTNAKLTPSWLAGVELIHFFRNPAANHSRCYLALCLSDSFWSFRWIVNHILSRTFSRYQDIMPANISLYNFA